jgi:hypothetical protein
MTNHRERPSLLDELQEHVIRADWAKAKSVLQEFLAAHESVHDGYRDVVARILSHILNEFGQDVVEQLNEAHATWEGLEPMMSLPPRDLVRRIADVNHWHMSRFRVTEDEQKVTFLLQPCGSGGRLINEGRYYVTDDRPYALMPRASRSTFSMPKFPVYCNHCSEMSRTILKGGGRGWLIEGWTQDHRFGGCKLCVFKNYENVSPEFFTRLEVSAPRTGSVQGGSLFSPEELVELSMPASTRLARALDAHNAVAALALIKTAEASWEWGLLPAYRSWVTELYAWVRRSYGPEAFSQVFRATVFDLFSKAYAMARSGYPGKVWERYWRCQGGLLQSDHVSGEHRLRVSITCLFASSAKGELFAPPVEPLCHSFNSHFGDSQWGGTTSMRTDSHGGLVMHIRTA